MTESGYMRDSDDRHHPYAVRWWYVEELEGGVFARGARVASSRIARREIENARHESLVERKRIQAMRRPTAELRRGELRDISRRGAEATSRR